MQLKVNKEKGILNLLISDDALKSNTAMESIIKIIDKLEIKEMLKTNVPLNTAHGTSGKTTTLSQVHDIKSSIERTSERLPNINEKDSEPVKGPNVIDMNDKSIKKVKYHSIKAYRCPHCGQAHIIKVDDNYIFRDVEKDKSTYLLNKFESEYSYTKIIDGDITADASTKGVTVLVSDDIKEKTYLGECPICHHVFSTNEWEEAFNTPEVYFEYTTCDICGGEMDFIKENSETHKSIMQCEKCKHMEEY